GNAFAFGAPVVGPDGVNLPAGVRRAADGVDTDTAADWSLLVFSPANAPANTPTAGTAADPEEPTDPEVTPISQVQGSGDTSPLAGQKVTVEGIVVGDNEGPAPALRGFFVQEEDADADDEPATSEGIFVFNGNADQVSLGDRVRVTGTVTEFDDLTELTQATTTVLSTGNPLPTPGTITFPVSAVADLEAFEGMVATLPQRLVVAEYFNFDRYGEVVVALPAGGEDFPMTPTAVFAPDDPAAAARASLNQRSRITVDDGNNAQNVAVDHPITGEPLTAATMFRGGDAVTGLTGPVFQAFDLYRILPYDGEDGYEGYVATAPAPSPEPVGGTVTAAWLNTLNYFTTIGATCGPNQDEDCRGADDAGEFDRQRTKLLNTLELLGADVVGLGELENTPGVEVLADLVAGLNDRVGPGTYDYIDAGSEGVVGPDVIKVGIIYQPAVVTPVGQTAVLDSMAFLDPNGTGEDRNRAAVAQSFRENATGEVFSVTANHLAYALGGIGGGEGLQQGVGQVPDRQLMRERHLIAVQVPGAVARPLLA
ncbi:MAG: ExeM/NucH family extracellular endonuclease, partial [Propionicimonas sp.]